MVLACVFVDILVGVCEPVDVVLMDVVLRLGYCCGHTDDTNVIDRELTLATDATDAVDWVTKSDQNKRDER